MDVIWPVFHFGGKRAVMELCFWGDWHGEIWINVQHVATSNTQE
jgi:hypothetical protein